LRWANSGRLPVMAETPASVEKVRLEILIFISPFIWSKAIPILRESHFGGNSDDSVPEISGYPVFFRWFFLCLKAH